MTTDHIVRFIHMRRAHYRERYEYQVAISDLWKNYEVTSQDALCTLFKVFNGNMLDAIQEFEAMLVTNKDIDFSKLKHYVVRTLPEDVDQEEAEKYVKHILTRLSRGAKIEAIRYDLIHFFYKSVNENDEESIKRIAHLQEKEEAQLRLYEWRCVRKEEIFSNNLKYAKGFPKPYGSNGWPVSGVYRIHEVMGEVSFCHVMDEFFEYEPVHSFEVFLAGPLSEHPSELSFASDESTQTDSSSSDSFIGGRPPFRLKLLTENLKVKQFMEYKYAKLLSTDSSASSRSVLEEERTHSSALSTASSTQLSSQQAGSQRKSRSLLRVERQPASDSSKSDVDVTNEMGKLVLRSIEPSKSLTDHDAKLKSDHEPEVITVSSDSEIGNSVIILDSSTNSSRSTGVSNGHAEKQGRSRSQYTTENLPQCNTSKSVLSEPIRVVKRASQDKKLFSPMGSVSSFYVSELGVSHEPPTIQTWEHLYMRFIRISAITKSTRRDAYELAIVLKPILVRFFTDCHEYRHVGYLRFIDPENLTDSQVLMFLFMKTLQNNEYTSGIIYRLLCLEMN